MRVDFMVIGAQKAGTTSLAAQLAAHPQICFCKEKEPGYFHKTEAWAEGLDEYHKLYDPTPGQLCGEASTYYTFFPEFRETHKRLHDYNPSLKLIYVMRQPVDRVISHYTHNRVREIDVRPPEIAVFSDAAYVDRSRYGVQIRPYLELFGPENVMLLVFEEYTADQIAALYRIADFLGIERTPFAVDRLNDHRSNLLRSADWVANQRATHDILLRVEHALDLVRIERTLSRVNDVIGAAAEPEIALGVEVADVAHAMEVRAICGEF